MTTSGYTDPAVRRREIRASLNAKARQLGQLVAKADNPPARETEAATETAETGDDAEEKPKPPRLTPEQTGAGMGNAEAIQRGYRQKSHSTTPEGRIVESLIEGQERREHRREIERMGG